MLNHVFDATSMVKSGSWTLLVGHGFVKLFMVVMTKLLILQVLPNNGAVVIALRWSPCSSVGWLCGHLSFLVVCRILGMQSVSMEQYGIWYLVSTVKCVY